MATWVPSAMAVASALAAGPRSPASWMAALTEAAIASLAPGDEAAGTVVDGLGISVHLSRGNGHHVVGRRQPRRHISGRYPRTTRRERLVGSDAPTGPPAGRARPGSGDGVTSTPRRPRHRRRDRRQRDRVPPRPSRRCRSRCSRPTSSPTARPVGTSATSGSTLAGRAPSSSWSCTSGASSRSCQGILDDDFGLRTDGGLVYVHTEDQLTTLREFVERRRRDGVDIRLVDGDEARALAPILPETGHRRVVLSARRPDGIEPLRPGVRHGRRTAWGADHRTRAGPIARARGHAHRAGRDGRRDVHAGPGRRRGRGVDAGAAPAGRRRDPDPRDATADRPDSADGARCSARSCTGRPRSSSTRSSASCRRSAPSTGRTRPRTRHGKVLLEAVCQRAGRVVPARLRDGLPGLRLGARPRRRRARHREPAGHHAGAAHRAVRPGVGRRAAVHDRQPADHRPRCPGFDDAYVAAGHVFGNGAGPTTGRIIADMVFGDAAGHGPVARSVPTARGSPTQSTRACGSHDRRRRPPDRVHQPVRHGRLRRDHRGDARPIRRARDEGRRHPPRRRPREHRLLLPQAPHGAGDLPVRAPARGRRLRRGRGRLLLRPGRQGRPRAGRHPGRRAARGGDEPRLVLRPSLHGHHRPSQGRAMAGGPGAAPRGGELSRRALPSTGTSPT